MLDTLTALHKFQSVARPIISSVHRRKNNCIFSVAVTIRVLAHFNISARPLRCLLGVYPAALMSHIDAYTHQHHREPTRVELAKWYQDHPGTRSVTIGLPRQQDADMLHLVALVDGGNTGSGNGGNPGPNNTGPRYLVDASVDQAVEACAQCGSTIELPFAVIVLEVPPLSLPDTGSIQIRLDSGGQLTYSAFDTSEHYWKASKEWTNQQSPYDQDAAVGRIIDAMQ